MDEQKSVVIKTFLGEFEVRKYEPLPENHPAVGMKCFFCEEEIKAGDETCLVPLRPAGEEEQAKMYQGRPYNCKAELAHWTCLIKIGVQNER
jgi:hypothetical protein